jgi:hypothetical protein
MFIACAGISWDVTWVWVVIQMSNTLVSLGVEVDGCEAVSDPKFARSPPVPVPSPSTGGPPCCCVYSGFDNGSRDAWVSSTTRTSGCFGGLDVRVLASTPTATTVRATARVTLTPMMTLSTASRDAADSELVNEGSTVVTGSVVVAVCAVLLSSVSSSSSSSSSSTASSSSSSNQPP